uniref:Uncharacterized protein n=1 Tax=Anguilla anguilla TaxID=7936 RepID=A0A0E9SIP9_ANGAN
MRSQKTAHRFVMHLCFSFHFELPPNSFVKFSSPPLERAQKDSQKLNEKVNASCLNAKDGNLKIFRIYFYQEKSANAIKEPRTHCHTGIFFLLYIF